MRICVALAALVASLGLATAFQVRPCFMCAGVSILDNDMAMTPGDST